MKTVEEKARVYAKKLVVLENKDKFSDEANLRAAEYYAYKSHLAGYAEAMRWRDFDQELPADGQPIIRKIVAIDENDMICKRNPYYTDIFHKDAANFDSEEYKNARMRFNYYWRPIE